MDARNHRYQAEKDHLMRYEGKHPANYNREEKAQHAAMMEENKMHSEENRGHRR